MQAPKNGFFYVVDRENGRLISARPFLPMSPTKSTPAGHAHQLGVRRRPDDGPPGREPGGALPRRRRAGPPRSSRRAQLAPDVVQPADRAWSICRRRTWHFGYAHDANPVTREGFHNLGVAFDPLPDDAAVRAAIKSASKGMLLAWDPVAQREVWRSDRRGPWNGGTLATAGGLVFQGTGDGQFLALDARTGKTLWSTDNQAATLAGPISYEIGGEQYVAVLAGYGGSFFLIEGFVAASEGQCAQRPRVRLQAGWHGAAGRRSICRRPRCQAARHRGQRRRLQSRRVASTNATARSATAWRP